MANLKFKIGDRVIIEASNVEGFLGQIFAGVEGVIDGIHPDPNYEYPYWVKSEVNRFGVYCKVKCLAKDYKSPKSEKIVITTDGKITAATLYGEMGTKKTATAKCAPEDKFDFFTGAELALRRLLGKEDVGMQKPEKPKYYNGKVVCVKSEFTRDFTVGKVYTFEDGTVKDNRGATRFVGHRITDLTEIKSVWKFIPFVEDEEKPLSIEELLKMDGQKVWVIALNEHKKPQKSNWLGGWHTVDVKNKKLVDDKDEFFYIDDNKTPFGFLAYRTAPRK